MEFTIRQPDDFHLHLRGGDMLRRVLPHSAKHFARGIIMPNVPAVTNREELLKYFDEINSHKTGFKPLMTVKIDSKSTPDMIVDSGAIAAKLYPAGVTTGSAGGVHDFKALDPIFDYMQAFNMVLCLHGEVPGVFCMDRETAFLEIFGSIAVKFPRLKIVLEHITTAGAVEWVNKYPNTAATITAHHLVDTLDSVIGDLLSPHRFCKPIPKRPEDRDALRMIICSGNPKFFFGSDSAPHDKTMKECASGCAGCFTAPVAIPTLAEIFLERFPQDNTQSMLENFTSKFGAEFYGLPLNTGTINLRAEPWVVPNEIDGIVPWRAGETIAMSVVP